MKKIITIITIIILALTLIIGLWIYYPFGQTYTPEANEKLTKHLNGENKDVNYETINTKLELKNIQEIYTIDKLNKNSYFVQGKYTFNKENTYWNSKENGTYLMGIHYNTSKNNISVEAIRYIRPPERASSVLYEKSDGSLHSERIAYKEYAVGANIADIGNTIKIEQNDKICSYSKINQNFEPPTCESPDPIDTASLVIYNRRTDYHENISKLPINQSPKHIISAIESPTGVLENKEQKVEAMLEWKKFFLETLLTK